MSNLKTTHHGHGGSALARQEICPFSFKAERGYKNEENENSIRGTKLHEACETQNYDGISDIDIDQCRWAIERVVEICGNYNVVKAFKEYRLEIKNPETGDLINHGTADVLLLVEDDDGEQKIVVMDYKFGFNPVKVKNNIQLQSYGVGACQEFNVTRCEYWIIQPALSYCASDSFDDINIPYNRIVDVIEATEKESPQAVTSIEGCRYCKHKFDCNAITKTQQDLVVHCVSDIASLEPSKVADILDKIGVVEKLLKDMKEKAVKYVDDHDGSIEGRYSRITVRGKSQPLCVEDAYKIAPEHVIRKYAKIGKTNLENAFIDANYVKGENTKKALKVAFKTKITPLLTFNRDTKKLIKL